MPTSCGHITHGARGAFASTLGGVLFGDHDNKINGGLISSENVRGHGLATPAMPVCSCIPEKINEIIDCRKTLSIFEYGASVN